MTPSKRALGEILISMFLPWGLKIKEVAEYFGKSSPGKKSVHESDIDIPTKCFYT